jgi:beta-galactosidase/beta-glucuronidase
MLQDAGKVTENGEALSMAGYQPAAWHRATVPGTVLTSLVNDGIYPEPLYGENNRPDKIPDTLCRTTWWYRDVFTVPDSYAGKQIWLNFNGINYTAEVWVNGKTVGSVKDAFARGIFDVTSNVVVGGKNVVAVHISPQPHPGETHEKTIATGTGLNGGITAIDGPAFLCTIGWDCPQNPAE